MKRLIYLFAALVALSSCTISEGWNPDQNLVAKMAANMATDEVRNQIHILSYAQIIDLYSRSGDGEREVIEDQHLPSVRLRQSDKGWDVVGEGGRVVLSFEYDTPLDTLGSVWTVINPNNKQLTEDQYWTIECLGKKHWQVEQSAHYEERSVQLSLDVVAGDQIGGQVQSSPVHQYSITGECSIVQNELVAAPYRIDMKVMEPIEFDSFKYYGDYTGTAFTKGKMSIRVKNYKTGEWVTTPFHYTIAPEYSNIKIEYLLIN
ncbi:MAG: hypothetical protein IIU53_07420 [Rikenellaceae bacterium]|nr:hypothetical protein [Rikenellaceae bacterium]